MTAKEAAGRRAAEFVHDGMVVGLGTGSTAEHAIRALGARVRAGLRVTAVASSEESENLGGQLGIRVLPMDAVPCVDLTIDGADEVDPRFRLIKGGGGALVREKLVAAASREMIVVVDAGKRVETLGRFPLPVAIVPFAWQQTMARLRRHAPDAALRLRNGAPYVTDDGLHIVDMRFGTIEDPEALNAALLSEPGVVDTGLFLGYATRVVVGHDDGRTDVIEQESPDR